MGFVDSRGVVGVLYSAAHSQDGERRHHLVWQSLRRSVDLRDLGGAHFLHPHHRRSLCAAREAARRRKTVSCVWLSDCSCALHHRGGRDSVRALRVSNRNYMAWAHYRADGRAGLFCLEKAWRGCGLVVYFINTHTFVAPNLARGEARERECIRSDTRPTEQRSHGPNWAQPGGRHVFWPEASLLAPHRSTARYARCARLASAQNPMPRTCAYL